ncbi:CTP synthase [Encephalitozoon intestinalis ATCC 50506]|uniref:CTP synthase n=1 Tax=Encephalitozoon intestinalis (strain ATCC 50506) TaxID=876142 RepID=E0SAF0_ENCIT|nr:CTP synthase [Encephalitozoon intestinalis ATCC 50506]ADM12575.2 CTP synthase [Encephalitozoon intestinalis ATCC 50506]UTX46431.1 CTP synthase [Encephalitozoon intestinalis]
MKYIFVSGGVISGAGKGVVSSSVGALLKSRGHVVTHIKIDPYFNYNAGMLAPSEHGEVYVLEDGSECDLDLGNYERFSSINLEASNAITSGKIFFEMIKREKEGHFLGKTLQINPHAIDDVIRRIKMVAETPVEDFKSGRRVIPDVVIIELGGTVGESESSIYTDAFAKFQRIVGRSNCAFVSVDHLVELESGEQKTKSIQMGCRNFRRFGLSYDIIVCRGVRDPSKETREKISKNCWVEPGNVFGLPNLESVYLVPKFLEEHGMVESLNKVLGISSKEGDREILETFERLVQKHEDTVRIGIVGKYSPEFDSYTSLVHALRFSGASVGVNVEIEWINADSYTTEDLEKCNGIIIPGGFGARGIEGKISAIRYARENRIPLLGICLGYQLSIIEMCRNVLGMKDASSEEFNPSGKNLVVRFISDKNGVVDKKLRVGGYEVELEDGLVKRLYSGAEKIRERHRHRFEVVRSEVSSLCSYGLRFVGFSDERRAAKIFELTSHPFFVGVQFHPEFTARPNQPHPLITGLISASCRKLN